MIMHTIMELDRQAVTAAVDMVDSVTEADLGRPTPCVAWDLRALINHMTAQHRGFAAAARGRGADRGAWRVASGSPDPVGAHRVAAIEVCAAFAQVGAREEMFVLPEIREAAIPRETAIGFHAVDNLVHAWDVARALDRSFMPSDELAATALRIARAVPVGAARTRPHAAFGPALEPLDDDPFDDVLRLLGRSPSWTSVEGCLPT